MEQKEAKEHFQGIIEHLQAFDKVGLIEDIEMSDIFVILSNVQRRIHMENGGEDAVQAWMQRSKESLTSHRR